MNAKLSDFFDTIFRLKNRRHCRRFFYNLLHFKTKKTGCNPVFRFNGGDKEDRTPDLQIANLSLSQLSYTPTINTLSYKFYRIALTLIFIRVLLGHSFCKFAACCLRFTCLLTKLRRFCQKQAFRLVFTLAPN